MLFSVIIPAYNAEKFIGRSVSSVLNQTFADFEIIIVNDGSKDKTSEKARAFSDGRITVIDKENEGVSVARNTGIMKAKGEFICFLDADDEFLPQHLEHLKGLMDEFPAKSFYATRSCVSSRDDANAVDMPATTGAVTYYENFVQEIIAVPGKICTGCICIKREMFDKYGLFERGVKLGEDVDMWERVYVHTGVVFSDNVTMRRNRDGSEATKNYSRRFEVDPLNRMAAFLSDDSISEEVKESLRTEQELTRLAVVRSHLYVGNKKKAKELLKEIDRSRIPEKRLLVTYLCFFVPSALIRHCLYKKNRHMYEK